MKSNRLRIFLLSALAIACLIVGLVVPTVFADGAKTIDDVAITMGMGASVRLTDTDGNSVDNDGLGLRYEVRMSEEDYQGLISNDAYSDLAFGVFIAPADYNEAYPINNEGELNDKYYLGNDELPAGKLPIINLNSQSMGEDANGRFYYASIVKFRAENLLRAYVGVGYIKYTYNSEVFYKFATANDNVRSMTEIAQKAIAELKDNPDFAGIVSTLEETYLTQEVKNTPVDYTVNHYEENASGTFDLIKTETQSGKIGAVADPTLLTGYTLKTEVEEVVLLANGKSVVNVYYEMSRTKAVETLVGANISNPDYNWASESAIPVWNSTGAISYGATDFTGTNGLKAPDFCLDESVILAAVAQGYDSLTVTASRQGWSGFWAEVYGGKNYGSKLHATSGEDYVFTKKISLSSLQDANGYGLKIFDGANENAIYLESLTFTSSAIEKQKLISTNISDPDYNWASESAIPVWNSTGAISYGATDFTGTNGLKAPDFCLDESVILAAVAQGYDSLTVTASRQGWSGFWAEVYGGKNYDSKLHATSGEGYVFTKKISLSSLHDANGYGLKIFDDANKSAIFVESLTFTSKAIEEEKTAKALAPIIEANISNYDYNWSNENVAMAWKSERNTISFDGGFKSTYNDAMSVNYMIFDAAEEQGYTQVKLSIEKVGSYDFWLNVYGAGKTGDSDNLRPGSSAAASSPCEFTVSLSDLKDGDGVYSLQISAAGGSGSSNSYQVKVTSLMFTSEAIERQKLISTNISNPDYNWANADAISVWSSNGTVSYGASKYANLEGSPTNHPTGLIGTYTDKGAELVLDKAVLEAAEAQGYTKVTVIADRQGGNAFWSYINGGSAYTQLHSQAGSGLTFTKTIALSSFKDDGGYAFKYYDVQNTAVIIISLTFSSEEIEKANLISANIENADYNWAAADNMILWENGNKGYALTKGAIEGVTDGVEVIASNKYNDPWFVVDKALIKAAADEGYTTATFVVYAKSYNGWWTFFKGERTDTAPTSDTATVLSSGNDKGSNTAQTWTVNITSWAGESAVVQPIMITTAGGGSTAYIASLTFSK